MVIHSPPTLQAVNISEFIEGVLPHDPVDENPLAQLDNFQAVRDRHLFRSPAKKNDGAESCLPWTDAQIHAMLQDKMKSHTAGGQGQIRRAFKFFEAM